MIFKCVLLGFLFLLSLSFQTPVQGRAFEKDVVVTILAVLSTDGVSPVTALTSKTTYVAAKRAPTEIPIAPVITEKPTPTLATSSSISTTISSSIPTKSLKNCNVQGTASNVLSSDLLGAKHAADILTCQLECMYRSRCESYSFQNAAPSVENCQFYTTLIDGKSKVISSIDSGVFFSDKYPIDGSNFCYGNTTL